MATLSHAQSRRMYSWWWDSHISPKNSKWLQENLTDMDAKVKQMIKLIEEDADSFARRAEMYYKKRPELMKMVEEFYRAYRALAERYDHATGVIRQAHRTMIEVFPNQDPLVSGDDSPVSSAASEGDPHTPEMPPLIRAMFDPDELHKDSLGLSSSNFRKSNGSTEGRVKKGLNFNDAADIEQQSVRNGENHNIKARFLSESERGGKSDREITILKEALAKLEAEKVAGLLQYQRSLEKLSDLETEVVRAQEDSRGLNERASKAEAEVLILKADLTKSEVEREATLLQYQQCLDKISNLEKSITFAQENVGELNELANRAETEAQAVKHDLSMVEAEKEAVLVQNNQLLIKVSDLEKKLLQAEEDARRINEQADNAESEVETLKQALAKLTEEKETAALQYQQCLETISILERQISCAQEEAQRLNKEIGDSVSKIKGAEERCLQLETSNQSLQAELESLVHKMGTQDQELTQKQQEVGTLWTCVKEERSRFVEVESAFQALQHLHSQSQEELRSMAAELQQRVQVLNELEMQNNGLQDELQKAKEENRSLNEHNFSSAMSIKNMQDELAILKEAREKLEEEVELRVDQRNALQQEIYCLKEEINDLNKKHQAVLEQMDSVGLNSECFGSAVKELQDENSELHEVCHRERSEKIAFFEKLEIMEKLLEKNAVLENSLSDLSAELEATREKVKELEQLCQFYLGEKSVLVAEKATVFSQLQITTENLGKLTEKNAFLENSLFDANVELEGFREKMKSLEKSFQLLDTEKSLLISEKESLVSQIQISQQKLEDLEKRYTELEEKYTGMEKEKESTLCKVEELLVSLDVEKKLTQLSATRLADLESQLFLLQEESQGRKKALEEELDEAVNAQIEIFILQKCVKDVENENVSLLVQCEKLLDTSELSKKLISELEYEKLEQQVEVKSFCDRINKMRIWMYQVLKALDTDSYHGCDDIIEQDRTHMDQILGKIEDKISSLSKTLDENQQLILENLVLSTLLGQLRLDAANLETDKNTHYQELITRTRELLALQNENQSLEEENSSICSQAISLSFLSLILKNTVKEKSAELKEFGENLDEIHGVNGIMEEKLKIIRGDLEMAGVENHHLKESLDKSDNELKTVRYVCDQLSIDVASGKEMLHQKEVELLEAEKKLELLQNEQMELQNLMEDLKRKFDEVKVIKEDQERQIHKLSEENDVLSKEGECLRGMTQTLEAKLLTLEEEYEEIKVREKTLRSQSENWRNEAELWETEGTLFFSELQISAIHGALFAEKIHELSEACQSLESKSNSNSMEIELVKERVGTLEEKNGELEAQMAACIPAINSLERSIASLENYALQCSEVDKPENEKDDKLESHLQAESCGELNENINAKVPEGFPIFQGLETRIKAIEKALIEMKRLATQEKLNNNREIEPDTGDDPKLRKLAHEISEAGSEILTKDIMLDQISECSPYGKSRTETVEADDQMLELWETTDQNGSIDLKVGKAQKMVTEPNSYHRVKAVEKEKSRNPASEISVDKLEISKRFAEPRQEGNKKNILERLASDAQKLTNLQITVQDLKRKVEITEKNKKGKGIEYGTVKEQLEESEEAILKLFDINKKLRNSAQEKALSSEEKYDADSEESGSVRRRRISEQARKGSEKIGRLQLEVQKLQFLLLKLDHGKENKGKTRITERKTRVLLRDYLYGGIIRPSHKRKKASFCACVQPPTKGD